MSAELLATEPAATAPEALSVDGVTVRLGGRTVLDDVSFSVRAGEFTGLIGSNGAGKTTLFRVILGLQPPLSGHVRVGDGRRGGADVGYVPQKFLLDPDMPLRGRDLIALGLDGHRLGVPLPSRARRARVDEMLDAVDACAFADDRVGQLSGGEQQRILIAHALISRPRLLLLDEPLANLDLRAAQEAVRLLSRIASEQRIAVLISAHEMNPLLPVMDRIVYLAAGRAASGSVDEVVRSEVLTELYGHHVDVLRVHGRVIVVGGRGHDEHVVPELTGGAPGSVEIVK
ncbi:MAG TPA: metal ABC transporter ATP-binding protein [Solirubrobacteraceae bacterium]|nr:metal ABC transporter ATP-binding protein [Solirubrobacteraceae bacterium]